MSKLTRGTALFAALALIPLSVALADSLTPVREALHAGDPGAAAGLLDEVLLANPGDPDAQLLAAEISWQAGDTSAALETLRELALRYPSRPEPLNNQAVILAADGQLGAARDLLEKAMTLQPGFKETHSNLGDVYSQLAAQAYQKAVGLARATQADSALRVSRTIGFANSCDSVLP